MIARRIKEASPPLKYVNEVHLLNKNHPESADLVDVSTLESVVVAPEVEEHKVLETIVERRVFLVEDEIGREPDSSI